MSRSQADLVARLLTVHPRFGDARYQPASDDFDDLEAVEIIPDLIYRYPQYDMSKGEDGPPVTLTVYLGLGELGGLLWEQEVRVLQRIGSLNHPALPAFLDGGQVPSGIQLDGDMTTSGTGYIRSLSDTAGVNAGNGIAVANQMHIVKDAALRQFWLLADGLSVLHDSRIAHRNLWPGTLDFVTDSVGQRAIRLARFEMSTMISNFLRHRGTAQVGQLAKSIYGQQDLRHVLFCPPERLGFVFGVPDALPDMGGLGGDTFSLGMIAAEWFVGPRIFDGADSTSPDGVRAAHKSARDAIAIAQDLPWHLKKLLSEMIHPTARERWEMARVVAYLDAHFEEVRAALLGEHDKPPHVIAYMKGYSDTTLLTWRYLTTSTDDEDGRKELEALLVKDMREAQVVHSPTGADGYVGSANTTPEERASAKTVIFGEQLVWFCSVLHRFDGSGDRDIEHVRVVRFVMERWRADRNPRLQELRSAGVRRYLFAVRPIEAFSTPMRRLNALAKQCSDWSELERTDLRVRALSPEAESYLGVLQWYLEFQRVQLDAGAYAYRLDSTSTDGGRRQLLRWNHELETQRRYKATALAQKYLSQERLRTPMPDHFAEAVAENPTGTRLFVHRDREGRLGEKLTECRFIETRGTEAIVVEADRPLPATGWIRLATDRATQRNIERQVAAVAQLGDRRLLVQQLVSPRGGATLPDRWRSAGGGLQGEGRAAVVALLTHEIMFALQGPPGTGKTEVTSQAIVDYLTEHPEKRLLVSAQAHKALDNLGLRVLRKLEALSATGKPVPTDWVVIRAASDATRENVDDLIKPFLPTAVIERLVANASERVRDWLTIRRVENTALAEVLTEWLAVIEHSTPDLRARALRGANVVLSTTGASTKETLIDDFGAGEAFDWVLVEEAAKAWPTELAMPLIHGQRWTLIGDHAQIGAFNRQQVETFLQECRDDPNPEIADWYTRREEFIRAFDTFGNLFANDTSGVTMELAEQYRMAPAISATVSSAFYANRARGGLIAKRNEAPHGLHAPAWLQGRTLVWLDTEDVTHVSGAYYNEYEADIVSWLVRSMHPQPGRVRGAPTLAVITPYRQQVDRLRRVLGESTRFVHTIDGFQGREADVVVASLVRDRARLPGQQHTNIGHLRDPARANVMLSRARDLLVVVGRLSVYSDTGTGAWDAVIAAFREHGVVIPVSSVMPL